MESRSLKQISVLMATVFVDMIGFTIILPLIPFYATRLGADASMVGVLIAAFPAAQLVVAPFWGRLSDRYGRRPMILAGLLSSAAAYLLFGLADTLWLLFASRLVQGAGGGTTGVVQAYVADAVVPEERTKALGWITAATSAGVMIGPLIGSASTYLGQEAPGYLAAGLCLLNALFAWKWLPEPKRESTAAELHTAAQTPRQSLLGTIEEVLRHPAGPVSSLIWVYTIGMMGFMAMNGVLALYLKEVFGITQHSIGYFYAYVGSISLVMRGILLGPAVRRFGEVGVTRMGALSLVIGLVVIPLPTSLWGLAVCVLFVPIGTALLFPATTSLVSRRARRSETGQVMGVQQLFGGVSRMLGPLWAGFVFQKIGIQYPFWIAAALMLGVSFLTLRMEREAPIVPEVGEIKPVQPS